MTANRYDVAAYIWPSYHYEPRLEKFWPERDGEWYIVRRAKPRFPGHDMPRQPLLGYQDEADPAVMRQHVELGAAYGVNTFIVDWYWFDGAPCFERQLNDGLLPALRGTDSKFYLMWANHDATSLWDMHDEDYTKPLFSGKVDRPTFEVIADRVIDRYFKSENYYRIDGKPVFCIYSPSNLVAGLGGVSQTVEALGWLRQRVKEKGLPGLHLQFIVRRGDNLGPEVAAELKGISYDWLATECGIDSGTTYQFACDAGLEGDYVEWAAKAMAYWEHDRKVYGTLFPQVSVGWDNTQRMPTLSTAVQNSTPSAFEACLHKAKNFLDAHPEQPKLVTINSWNEWTEGSYLLPDMRWGYGYLEAVKKVFVDSIGAPVVPNQSKAIRPEDKSEYQRQQKNELIESHS